MKRGIFITLEGGEGAGKSTVLAFVRDWLLGAGHPVQVTREPGGTALGERVRDILLHAKEVELSPDTETLLMFATPSPAHQLAGTARVPWGRSPVTPSRPAASVAGSGSSRRMGPIAPAAVVTARWLSRGARWGET